MSNKLYYYETQSYLIKRETSTPRYIPDKHSSDVIDVSDIPSFKVMINDCLPYAVFYRCYNWNDKLESDIAYAIVADCSVTLSIDCIDTVVTFDTFDNIQPSEYKNYPRKNLLFDYIKRVLRDNDVTKELEYYKAFKEKCDQLSLEPIGFELTEEIINFITTWAPAYDIPVPKFYDTLNSNERDLPRHWITNIEELKEKCSDFKKSMSKWDCSGMKTLKADSLASIKRTFDSLQFYRRNNIPINDGWRICKHCGLPYNTTHIEDTVNNRFINICRHCDTVYPIYEVTYCSDKADHIPTRGRKVRSVSND